MDWSDFELVVELFSHFFNFFVMPNVTLFLTGLVTPENKIYDSDSAEDNKPYHILSYANGPGMLTQTHNQIIDLNLNVSLGQHSKTPVKQFSPKTHFFCHI